MLVSARPSAYDAFLDDEVRIGTAAAEALHYPHERRTVGRPNYARQPEGRARGLYTAAFIECLLERRNYCPIPAPTPTPTMGMIWARVVSENQRAAA